LDQFSDPGGAQQVLLELLPAIRRQGWEALVGLPGEGALFAQIRGLGFDAVRIACGPFASGRKSIADIGRMLAQTPKLARQIRGLVREWRADLIYINGPRLLPAAALAGSDCPVLFHSHSYLSPGPVWRIAGASLSRLGAHVIGSCGFVADRWRNFVPSSRISVIYNGVAGARPWGRTHTEGYTVGCIGRIAPEKGQREFVAAAAMIAAAVPNCRFPIYGTPLFGDEGARTYDEEVRSLAAGLPIEFAGWCDDVHRVFANLDLLLVPSAPHDATPRVILEAFTAGVPVIAFRSGGIPELIEDGRTGFLAASAREMAHLAIELLTQDRERLARTAQFAAAKWRSSFTLDRFQSQIMQAIQVSAAA
jgi:glycosyltransferase involved in cell wall biosynthesis